MIKYIQGDLLSANAEALVNTVNTVGVMGKGIALQFKERYPSNFKIYSTACKRKELKTGKMLIVTERTLEKEQIIINFPTKTEWYQRSQYSFIEEGLKDLVNVINKLNIKSIAIPPLGCGNGGLKWDLIKSMMERYLSPLECVDIQIFEPNETIKEILKKQDSKKEVKLTPAKAMILYSMFYYESLGSRSSLFIANKLAYFLHRMGEPSFKSLNFSASYYGPYSVQVDHLMQSLNGKYLRGLEQMKVKAFEEISLEYSTVKDVSDYVRNNLKSEQLTRLAKLTKLINGFESTLALEVLASVDFIRKENPSISEECTIIKIQNWTDRKKNLFKEKHISIAYKHLEEYANSFF